MTAPTLSTPKQGRTMTVPRWLFFTIIAAVAVVLAICAVIVAVRHDGGRLPHTVSGPLGDRRAAEFSLVSGVTTITVRGLDSGTDLYRVSTPPDANLAPRVRESDGRVELHLVADQGRPLAAVEVQLNSRVRWQVHIVGGATTATVDLRDAGLSGLDFAAGVGRVEIWLPAPKGTVDVRSTGGASELLVHAPARVPVRLTAGGGAATVSLDTTVRTGVQAGTVVSSDGWEASTDRYDVTADAGVSRLAVDRY